MRGKHSEASGSTLIWSLPTEWAFVAMTKICPQCHMTDSISRLIPHLNDVHRWTREEIAGWIAKHEQPEAEPVEAIHAKVSR